MADTYVTAVVAKTPMGEKRFECDYCFSSMPLRDLVMRFNGITIPQTIKDIADKLPYRDFITVGLLVKQLLIRDDKKNVPTYKNRVPDTWIYVQERDVKVGRLQIFNNWSPYMVRDYKNTMFIGMEYFCNEADELWAMSEKDFINMAIDELEKIKIIDKSDVLDAHQVKIKKAYPAYFGSYNQLPQLRTFLNSIPNLYCIGRNGQHRYNNMDHSMLTAMEAVDNIVNGKQDKDNVWNVNTETDYHEEKKQ